MAKVMVVFDTRRRAWREALLLQRGLHGAWIPKPAKRWFAATSWLSRFGTTSPVLHRLLR